MSHRLLMIPALACFAVLGRAARAQDSGTVRLAAVTYLTGTSAYIGAGREAGLREGALVEVVRGGSVIATLKVAFLASRQASCDIVTETVAIAVGDSVRFRAAAMPAERASAARATPRAVGARSTLRGRLGAHYLSIDRSGGSGFTQPSVDLRLDGRPRGPEAALGVAVDVRARRNTSNLSTGETVIDGHARAYQLAVFWNPPSSPARITVGRQLALANPSVGLFDGVTAELNTAHWSAGMFGGSQPEPHNLGFATDIVEAGAYVQRRSARDAAGRQWSATVGLSGSYQNAKANREFVSLQAAFSGPRLVTLISQEIDYYRPWKRAGGMPALSPTSTFVMARYRVGPSVDLHGGFDNRQSVFLYRDAVNPVTTFDDAFRQGVWGGVSLRFSGGFTGGLEARHSTGGGAGTAAAYTASFGAERLAGHGFGVRGRSTYYRSPGVDGWLHSATLAADPGRVHVALSGGARIERDPLAVPERTTISWVGSDVDLNVARAWYLLFSASVERGGVEAISQVYTGFSVRF